MAARLCFPGAVRRAVASITARGVLITLLAVAAAAMARLGWTLLRYHRLRTTRRRR